MRMNLAIGCVVSLALAAAPGPARACGDTAIGIGHEPVRSAGGPARASVLVLQDPADPQGSLLRDPDLSAALAAAGFANRVVSNPDEVRQALSGGSFEVILAGVKSAPVLKSVLDGSNGKPGILPVVHNGSKEEVAAARAAYGEVVTSPARARALAAAIEEAAGRSAAQKGGR